jgi:LmbE family N-acetylglucosaminyl deacetylase
MSMMKRILVTILLVIVFFIVIHLGYLSSLSATEDYPEDAYFDKESNKNALIIVAHDDDAVSCAGTISQLCRSGWSVRELCFYQQSGIYRAKDSSNNTIRKLSLAKAAKIQGLSEVVAIDLNFRTDLDTNKAAYMPMPYDQFPLYFKTDTLYQLIAAYIEKHKPSVIFMLDDSMGGYGHPEHVLISQLVLKHCRNNQSNPGFSVTKIYQPVFPPSLSENILAGNMTYEAAKKVYNLPGMPLPDVQITIYGTSVQKKEVMQAYTTEQNSLNQIWPYYRYYPAKVYFSIFNREFFRVLDVEKL